MSPDTYNKITYTHNRPCWLSNTPPAHFIDCLSTAAPYEVNTCYTLIGQIFFLLFISVYDICIMSLYLLKMSLCQIGNNKTIDSWFIVIWCIYKTGRFWNALKFSTAEIIVTNNLYMPQAQTKEWLTFLSTPHILFRGFLYFWCQSVKESTVWIPRQSAEFHC